ncbi:DsbA family oxidoreductase [Patulibacter sp. S7RM1-6]
MPTVDVTTFTDPACPWAFSAEPIRWRLRWRYGDQLRWSLRMAGLSKDGSSYARMDFTEERAATLLRHFDRLGQPLFTGDRRPVGGTWPACRAIVAVREHEDVDRAVRLLRELHRMTLVEGRAVGGEDTIAEAAGRIGLDADAVAAWTREEAVEDAFHRDLHDTRHPSPAALALDAKLAGSGEDWQPRTGEDAGPGRRYTCPSYVVSRRADRLEAPGFHTPLTIETLVANLAPDLRQRPWAEDPLEVLRWAGEPLSTQEVAGVLDLVDDRDEARRRLEAAGATEHPAGTDAYWTAD